LPALRIQPLAASDLGRVLAEVAGAPAGAGIQEIAGPDELGLDEWGHQLVGYAGLRLRILTAPTARPFFGAAIDERALLPAAGARQTTTSLLTWLTDEPRDRTAASR
jgi:uncharacterized protein YbjT (DUF2867 family)